MRKRPVFGVIFLLTGLAAFGFFLSQSMLTEVGPPPGVSVPERLRMESTNQEPILQFNVVKWLGWAFVLAAVAEIGAAYMRTPRTTVDE